MVHTKTSINLVMVKIPSATVAKTTTTDLNCNEEFGIRIHNMIEATAAEDDHFTTIQTEIEHKMEHC